MIVTKIETQKKKKGRYNIYIDEVFAFGVDEATLIKFSLYNGMVVTNDDILAIQQEDHYQQAYQKALSFLNYKMRTIKEVADKLEQYDYEEETINQVLQKLVELKFLDDKLYAESYLNENEMIQKKGSKAVLYELRKKGISERVIQEAMDERDSDRELTQALEVANSYIKRQTQVSVRTAKQKVYSYLLQKGYPSEIVEEVVVKLEFEQQEEQEVSLAVKEILQVYQRYVQKKTEGQLWYFIKGKLYQKGFSSGTIEEAMAIAKEEIEAWT